MSYREKFGSYQGIKFRNPSEGMKTVREINPRHRNSIAEAAQRMEPRPGAERYSNHHLNDDGFMAYVHRRFGNNDKKSLLDMIAAALYGEYQDKGDAEFSLLHPGVLAGIEAEPVSGSPYRVDETEVYEEPDKVENPSYEQRRAAVEYQKKYVSTADLWEEVYTLTGSAPAQDTPRSDLLDTIAEYWFTGKHKNPSQPPAEFMDKLVPGITKSLKKKHRGKTLGKLKLVAIKYGHTKEALKGKNKTQIYKIMASSVAAGHYHKLSPAKKKALKEEHEGSEWSAEVDQPIWLVVRKWGRDTGKKERGMITMLGKLNTVSKVKGGRHNLAQMLKKKYEREGYPAAQEYSAAVRKIIARLKRGKK